MLNGKLATDGKENSHCFFDKTARMGAWSPQEFSFEEFPVLFRQNYLTVQNKTKKREK